MDQESTSLDLPNSSWISEMQVFYSIPGHFQGPFFWQDHKNGLAMVIAGPEKFLKAEQSLSRKFESGTMEKKKKSMMKS